MQEAREFGGRDETLHVAIIKLPRFFFLYGQAIYSTHMATCSLRLVSLHLSSYSDTMTWPGSPYLIGPC